MSERRNVAASGAIAVLAVLAGTLTVRQWLAGLFSDVGPDRAADIVLFALLAMCGGVAVLATGFLFVWLIVRAKHERETPARADIIDAQPSPMLAAAGRSYVPAGGHSWVASDTADADAAAMMRLKPFGITPTEAVCAQRLGITSSRRVQAAWRVLEGYGLLSRPGQGAAVQWTSPGEGEA